MPPGVHYTSTGTLPMIPGIDAVGRRPDGKRIYFVADDDALGTMADKAVVDVRRAIELPDDVERRQGRGRDEPGHVVVGGPAAPRPDRSPARASWSWA